jgi:RHS repeat-associated protein
MCLHAVVAVRTGLSVAGVKFTCIRLNMPTPYPPRDATVRLDTNPEVAAQLTGEEWEVAGGGISVPVDGNNHTLLINATDADGKISARTLTLNYNAEASSSYVYDLRGNLVQKTVHTNPLQITSYTYDALNRLLSVSSVSSVVQYRYDYLNRRISKTVTTGTGGSSSISTEYYLWSGMNQIGIMDGNLSLLKFRMLGEGMGAEVGSAVAVEIGQTNYIPVHDQRGNVVAMVDKSTSAVAESYRYDAYGNVKIYNGSHAEISSSAISNPWLFSSKELDSETGLYYFTRRYYDPTLGRFVTTDPLGITDGINMYGYAGGNPMMFVDPTGLLAKGAVGLAFKGYQTVGYYGFFYWAGADYMKPEVAPTEKGNPDSNEVIFSINGILNNLAAALSIIDERVEKGNYKTGFAIHNPSARDSDEVLHRFLRSIPFVGGLINSTVGGTRDIIQTVGQKMYMPDRTAQMAAEKIEEYARDNPNDVIHSVHLHSQAGAIAGPLGMYLDDNIQASMGLFSYGSAANPLFGWNYQVHNMNVFDPVPLVSGHGLGMFPTILIDAFRPNVDQNWNFSDQQGKSGFWYHSWDPSYMYYPARR